MPPLVPTDLVARLRRDVERSVRRTRNGLRHLSGVGHPTVGATPRDVVWTAGKTELWRYRRDVGDARAARTPTPPVLFVHSLVSRSYVFDLAPGNSFVEHLLGRGFDVFLTQWGEPDELEAGYTLETYCDELLPEMVHHIGRTTGAPEVNIFGYCFGGVLSLLYAAGHAADPIRALAVMAVPVDFTALGAMTGLFRSGRLEPASMLDATGNLPADVVRSSFRLVQPTAGVTTYVNLLQHLWDDDYLAAHQAMIGWSQDHIPFPGACFLQVADRFGRDNDLAAGRVPLGDRVVDLSDIRAPFLNIIGEKDRIIPPPASGPLLDLIGAADKTELRLAAGHVGLIVGRAAHERHIPAMADWLARQSG